MDDREGMAPTSQKLLTIQVVVLTLLIVGMMVLIPACSIRKAEGAPVPLPKTKKAQPPDLVAQLEPKDLWGEWRLSWAGSDYTMKLSPFGTYECRVAGGGGSLWLGTWHADALGRLWVSEAWVDENGVAGASMAWFVAWGAPDEQAKPVSRSKPWGEATCQDDDGTLRRLCDVKMSRPAEKKK